MMHGTCEVSEQAKSYYVRVKPFECWYPQLAR